MLENILTVLQQNTAFYLLSVFVLSLAIGSFLNVVIHRLPLMMQRSWKQQCSEILELDAPVDSETLNLIAPRSRCPHCKHPIGALENIPVISYLLQKGRCKHCGEPISPRYPIIESVTALLSVVVAWRFGVSEQALFAVLLTWALITLSMIDFDTTLLPDDITLPFLWLGILLGLSAVYVDIQASVIGAVAGYLSLWLVYHVFKLLTGKEGMGYGDFKLLALLGAWMGWQQLPLVIILSSIVGAVVGVSLILFRGRDRNIPIPFGPYLAAAGWIALLWGDAIVSAYINWITPA